MGRGENWQGTARCRCSLLADTTKTGHLYYPCSFTVLDATNMEFLFGLEMLWKHQRKTSIDTCVMKRNCLRQRLFGQATMKQAQPWIDVTLFLFQLASLLQASVIQAFKLFNGNGEQSVAFLFGG